MKRIIIKILDSLLICLGIFCTGIYPFWVWVLEPELTQMQILIECWPIMLLGLIGFVVALFIETK